MKKLARLAAACAAVLALLSACDGAPELSETCDTTQLRIAFTPAPVGMSDGDPGTKAVKSAWEDGDAILIFFSGVGPGYLRLDYTAADGSWRSSLEGGLSVADLRVAATKRLRAVYLPFGNPSVSYDAQTGFVFDPAPQSLYWRSGPLAYAIESGALEPGVATLSLPEDGDVLTLSLPDGFVQFYYDDPSASDGFASLRVGGLSPASLAGVSADGSLRAAMVSDDDALPGYAYRGGYLFSGILRPDLAGVAADYALTLTRDNRTMAGAVNGKTVMASGRTGRAFNISQLGWTVIPPSAAEQIFVAPDGDDAAGGSLANPLKTVAKAVEKIASSATASTIVLRGGSYTETVDITLSGRPGRPLVIKAYAGETPVFDGGNGRGLPDVLSEQQLKGCHHMDYYQNISPTPELTALYQAAQVAGGRIKIKGDYILLEGISVTGSTNAGIWCYGGASHLTIRNCTITHCLAPGICFGADNTALKPASPSSDIRVVGNLVDNCAQISREAISLRTVDRFEVADNTVKNVIKESIDAKSGCTRGSIHHNRIVNSGHVGIYLDAGFANVGVAEANIEVYANTIENPFGTAICVASESGNDIHGIRIYNNLVYSFRNGNWPADVEANTGVGIKIAKNSTDVSGTVRDIHVYHNTVYGFAQQGIYVNYTGPLEGIVIAGNISAQNLSQIALGAGVDPAKVSIAHNLIQGAATHPGDPVLSGDPCFAGAAGGDFTLLSASPAIDAIPAPLAPFRPATDLSGNPRPRGTGFDPGAFEYQP